MQVELLLGVLSRMVLACGLTAVELRADERTRQQRVENRWVCHTCEHDPVHDPRLPATPCSSDPWRCARCGGLLHPRRGDAPRLFSARTARFEAEAPAVRQALADAGIAQFPYAPALLTEAPDEIREALCAAMEIHCTYRAAQGQITIRATITDTTPGIVTALAAALIAHTDTANRAPDGYSAPP